jgi:hypothetical protein
MRRSTERSPTPLHLYPPRLDELGEEVAQMLTDSELPLIVQDSLCFCGFLGRDVTLRMAPSSKKRPQKLDRR